MIKDQLRELGVRLDQMEQVALAIPTEYWPDAFDAVLQGLGDRGRMPNASWTTTSQPRPAKTTSDITDPGPRCGPTLTVPETERAFAARPRPPGPLR